MKNLMAAIASLLFLTTLPIPAHAQAAWLSGWTYRVPVTVTNTAGVPLDNFQVNVTLNGSFSFAQAKSDGSDLRLTGSDGVTLIPFWLQSWNPSNSSASVWVRISSVPAAGTTLYLYYGNAAASSASNGDTTFEFFDDFDSSLSKAPGYFELGKTQTELVQDQGWEDYAPHTMSVVQVNSGGFAYWGYYGLQEGCGGVGLARSNDLVNWTKYTGNPLFMNGRWPSVLLVQGKYYMAYNKDYCSSFDNVTLATSTDGLNFTNVKTLVTPNYLGNAKNHNPNLFLNPKDGLYYLYWASFDTSSQWTIRARSAATPEGLDSTASEVTIMSLSSPTSILAAPDMLYYDGTYYLATEVFDGNSQTWLTNVYASTTSPTSGFSLLPANPVLSDGGACMFQHVFGTTLHNYYCKLTNGVWTLEHRSADLTARRPVYPTLDSNKWTAGPGIWSLTSDTQQDGSTGKVVQGNASSRQILLSRYSGTDYIVEAFGKQIAGRVWGLGVRATDANNLFSVNFYEDLDTSQNLWMYKWFGNSLSTLGSSAVGTVNLNTWYKLTVKASNSGFDLYTNDTFRLHTADGGFPSGHIALYGEAGTIANFDNVLVRKYAAADPSTNVGPVQRAISLTSLTLNPTSVFGGASATGTVTLSGPATGSAADRTVMLSDNSALTTTPASVTVATGATSATFAVATNVVTTSTSAIIVGNYNGTAQKALLTVNPVTVATLTINPNSVIGGLPATGTVTLNGPAPQGGAVVTLTDDSPFVSIPSSVTVAAGATSATFTVKTGLVLMQTSATIKASYNGTTQSATLKLDLLPILKLLFALFNIS